MEVNLMEYFFSKGIIYLKFKDGKIVYFYFELCFTEQRS